MINRVRNRPARPPEPTRRTEPTGDLPGDLDRAIAKTRGAEAAFNAAFYWFQSHTETRPEAEWGWSGWLTMSWGDPLELWPEKEREAAECFRLANLYWSRTMRQMHGDRKRSARHIATCWARLFNAYAAIAAIWPGIIEHIRAAAPEFADSLVWMEKCATGSIPT